MSNYLLYYSPDSANLVVRAALEECGAAYRTQLVDRGRGQQRSAEYLALNPQGLIPVLVHGEVVIFETAAILLYLVDRHADLGPRVSESGRADLYRWLFFISNTLHADLRVMFNPGRYQAHEDAVETLVEGVRRRVLAHLSLLDGHMRTHSGVYLLASGFSVCDLYAAMCCRWAMIYPDDHPEMCRSISALPGLWALLSRLETRPSVDRACSAEWIEPPYLIAPRRPQPPVGSVLG